MGQLGHASPSYATLPRMVSLPEGPQPPTPWQVAVGGYHTILFTSGSTIFAFGNNDDYQLGDWSGEHKRKPVKLFKAIP